MMDRFFGAEARPIRFRLGETSLTAQEFVCRAYEEHRLDVFRYLMSLGLAAAAAQDVSQEVFLFRGR